MKLLLSLLLSLIFIPFTSAQEVTSSQEIIVSPSPTVMSDHFNSFNTFEACGQMSTNCSSSQSTWSGQQGAMTFEPVRRSYFRVMKQNHQNRRAARRANICR